MYRATEAIEVNAAFNKEIKQARNTQTSMYFQCKTPLSALKHKHAKKVSAQVIIMCVNNECYPQKLPTMSLQFCIFSKISPIWKKN